MLIEKLLEKKAQLKMNEAEFATYLGCSRPLWSMTRRGLLPVQGKIVLGVHRRFPDLVQYISDVVSGDVAKIAS